MSKTIASESATASHIKALLDQGYSLYPIVDGYEMLVYKDEGKYVLRLYQDLYKFPETEEGVNILACFIAFQGVTYV